MAQADSLRRNHVESHGTCRSGANGGAVMERLLHRAGPAVPIFGSPRSQGTSYLWASGSAVKKRLLRRAGSAAAIFGLTMAVAHIGPTTLWIAVVKVAVALGIFAERWRCPARQRWRPGRAAQGAWLRPRTPYRHCGWSVRRTYSGVLFRSAVTSAPSPPGTFSPGSAQARSRAVMRRPGSRWSGTVERPSANAGHMPSWHGSCERCALSPVAAGSRWPLLLLSPLLSSARRDRAWLSSPPGCGPCAPPLPPSD